MSPTSTASMRPKHQAIVAQIEAATGVEIVVAIAVDAADVAAVAAGGTAEAMVDTADTVVGMAAEADGKDHIHHRGTLRLRSGQASTRRNQNSLHDRPREIAAFFLPTHSARIGQASPRNGRVPQGRKIRVSFSCLGIARRK